jgi:hypothetical protein
MAKTRSASKGTPHRFGGDWTQAKLDVLKDYLVAYTKALKDKPTAAQPFRKAYIDAFAGTGSRTARERESSGVPASLLFPDLAEPAPQKLLGWFSEARAAGRAPLRQVHLHRAEP